MPAEMKLVRSGLGGVAVDDFEGGASGEACGLLPAKEVRVS